MKTALVLFAHGSRDPDWGAPFRAIRRNVAAARPDVEVELAFLEVMQPSLPVAVDRLIADGCERITIAPLFMAQGAHLKRDLSRIVEELQARHGQVKLALLPAAGEAQPVMEAISGWLAGNVGTPHQS
jgi:sirohydrochlorin cobaltochelatase